MYKRKPCLLVSYCPGCCNPQNWRRPMCSFIQGGLTYGRHLGKPESGFLDSQTRVQAQKGHFSWDRPTSNPRDLATWQLNITFIFISPSNLISISYFSIVPVIEELVLVQLIKDSSFCVSLWPLDQSYCLISNCIIFQEFSQILKK